MSPQVPCVVRSKDPTVREGGDYENGGTLKFGGSKMCLILANH